MKKLQLLLDKKQGYLQIDFLFIVLFFFLFFGTIYAIHSNMLSSLEEQRADNYFSSTSQDVCQLLLSHPGLPSNWEENPYQVVSPGLMSKHSYQELDDDKIDSLFNQNFYSLLIDKFDISGVLHMNLVYSYNHSIINSIGSSREFPSQGSSSRCFSNYQNTSVYLEVEIWR